MKLLEKYPKKGSKTASRVIDGQAVVVYLDELPDEKEKIHILNQTGTRIWQLLDGKTKTKRIVEALCDEFEIKENKAQQEIVRFLQELLSKSIIDICDEPQLED